jgi:hypothetical protein
MNSVIFGFEEILSNLIEYLCESSLSELNLVVFIDHL